MLPLLPALVNGLDPVAFPPVLLLDLDDVVFEGAPLNVIPGAIERVLKLQNEGWRVWLFSCGVSQERVALLRSAGLNIYGAIPKPLACRYAVLDDRLDLAISNTSTRSPTECPIPSPALA